MNTVAAGQNYDGHRTAVVVADVVSSTISVAAGDFAGYTTPHSARLCTTSHVRHSPQLPSAAESEPNNDSYGSKISAIGRVLERQRIWSGMWRVNLVEFPKQIYENWNEYYKRHSRDKKCELSKW